MAVEPLEHEQHTLDADARQNMIQQAQAAAAAQTKPATLPSHKCFLENTDLTAPDVTEDGDPLPPAYGDLNGEVRASKDGLDTSVSITDDGRVNIRINQLNRRLSQVFAPALRQHIQSIDESPKPSSPTVPPSLGVESFPQLNIVMQVVGSRGDVQPFIALGKVLKETYGHRVRVATHPNFKDFVQKNGLEFFSIGGDPARLMAFMVKNPALMPGVRSLVTGEVRQRRRDVAEYIQGCWRSCYQAGNGISLHPADEDKPFVADCIIANPPSFAHIHCAEKMGVPLHIMFTMPFSPTQAFPHPLANVQSSEADPQLTNYLSYAMIEVLSWHGLGDIINRFRRRCLGLDPISLVWAPGMLQRLKVPHTYCWSPALVPKPKDWGPQISISGYCILSASDYTPPADLQAFLDAGPPPVYVGFGSIVLDDPAAMTSLIFEAKKMTGQRMLVSKGWGGIGAELEVPNGVLMLGNVPHDWLFKRVSCVVHHGGAGTTAAGIAAGRPTAIVPFFGDQPFWGTMISQAGAGPVPIPHKQLTAARLADSIEFCLSSNTQARAQELACKIAMEQGSDTASQSFHQHLEPDRLRCTLAPSRAATWRIKRTKIRLSAFAACTLANAGLVDFHDLKLYRPQEYETDEGPWDPISGGFVAACEAFSGMAMGLADMPTETYKALQLPFKHREQRSEVSLAKEGKTKNGIFAPNPVGSSNASPASLTGEADNTVRRNPSTPSSCSSSTVGRYQSTTPNSSRTYSATVQDSTIAKPSLDSYASRSSTPRDMLRPNIHQTKGLGRFTKALVQSPMELSMGLTKGCHNLPKLWNDTTVRPQARVSDFKSGARAAGKGFGLGWYDGVTGLATQPWNCAREGGVGGFMKGVGKGIGGFISKPTAGLLGILGYTMKGVHKEVQKLFGGNVQDYIIASRTTQGYEEWLRSSDAEKEDVVARWKLIQKYLKKRRTNEELMRDLLEAQGKQTGDGGEVRQHSRPFESGSSIVGIAGGPITQHDSSARTTSSLRSSQDSLEAMEFAETLRLSLDETTHDHAENDGAGSHLDWTPASQRQQQHDGLDFLREGAKSPSATATAKSQAQQAKSLERSEPDRTQDASDHVSPVRADCSHGSGTIITTGSGSSSVQQRPSNDLLHLAGVTQMQFETERQQDQREKTAQEKTEEDIVLAYVKKQSLLEDRHWHRGKGCEQAMDDDGDADLQMALALSMQDHTFDVTDAESGVPKR